MHKNAANIPGEAGVLVNKVKITWQKLYSGLDIGYVPAGPDAFFRWSGQFGPQQLIFYWPAGPVDFYFFIFFIFF